MSNTAPHEERVGEGLLLTVQQPLAAPSTHDGHNVTGGCQPSTGPTREVWQWQVLDLTDEHRRPRASGAYYCPFGEPGARELAIDAALHFARRIQYQDMQRSFQR